VVPGGHTERSSRAVRGSAGKVGGVQACTGVPEVRGSPLRVARRPLRCPQNPRRAGRKEKPAGNDAVVERRFGCPKPYSFSTDTRRRRKKLVLGRWTS